MTTLVAVRGWSEHIGDLSHLRVSFLFSFFFAFFSTRPRSHFLTDMDDLNAKTRVSGQRCAFCESRQRQYLIHLWVKPQKLPRNGRGINIFQAKTTEMKNPDISKICQQIDTKFSGLLRTTNTALWVVK